MKKRILALATVVLMIFTVPLYSFAEDGTPAASYRQDGEQTQMANELFYVKGTLDYSEASDVLTIVNKERRAAGLPALTMDVELQQAAMQRAAETALYFSHERPDGTSCFTVSNRAFGENIAAGQNSAKLVMKSWMRSQGHRENILRSNFASIGIGCFYQKNGTKCWVQLFGGDDAQTVAAGRGTKQSTFTIQAVPGRIKPYLQSSSTMTVAKGKTTSFSVYIRNQGWSYLSVKAEPQTFRWTSSNSNVSVNTSGTITGKKQGSATIRASLPVSGQTVSKKVTVEAAPKKAALRSVKTGNRTLKVTWKRNKKASGYQVLIARNKKFTKGKKRATISKNRTTSKTFKKLKRKKVYYVKVRAYKKAGGSKLYGSYSKVKRVKVK